MDVQKDLTKDLKVDFGITGGKVVLTITYAGADAAIDALKPSLPSWLGPILDLAKTEIDKL